MTRFRARLDPPGRRAALAIAACAIVAAAATGYGLLVPASSLDGGRTLALRLIAFVTAAAALAALVMLRRELGPRAERDADPLAVSLVAAALIMAALALTARMAPRAPDTLAAAGPPAAGDGNFDPSNPDAEGDGVGGRGGSRRPLGLPVGGFRGLGGNAPRPGFVFGADAPQPILDEATEDRLRSALRFLALLLLGTAIIMVFVRRRPAGLPDDLSIDLPLAAAAHAGLAESLDAVSADADHDPRASIIAAYRRLLALLTDAGAPREPHEAPHEHLRRTLGPLGVAPEPMHRLADLFVLARFSTHPVTDRHRAEAARALESALADLRAARGTAAAHRTTEPHNATAPAGTVTS